MIRGTAIPGTALLRFFRAPVFVLSMNGPLGGAGLDVTQKTLDLNQRLGICRALCVHHRIEIFDGNALPAGSMLDFQLRFPVEIHHLNL